MQVIVVFGDSCIYLHDRGDYKSGWEMEKEWDEEQKKKSQKFQVSTSKIDFSVDDEPEEEEESDGLPTECPLCHKKFKNPVVTTCKHYFCEKCAFEHFKTSKRCLMCQKPLNGIFNVANEIIEKMKGNSTATKPVTVNGKMNLKVVQDLPNGGADENSSGNEDKLDGVEFDHIDKNDRGKKLEKLTEDFKADMLKNKTRFKSESDWIL